MEVRFAALEQVVRYKLLIGLVYPRPIALISCRPQIIDPHPTPPC